MCKRGRDIWQQVAVHRIDHAAEAGSLYATARVENRLVAHGGLLEHRCRHPGAQDVAGLQAHLGNFPRERGTPQGGVVSPILMNLFMHYTFDAWMTRTNPSCPFARYADDAVVQCRTREQAEEVMRSIASRLTECGLTMHPEKSKVVYCKDGNRTASYPHVSFTFLGFTFRPRKAIDRQKRAFTNFLPGVSPDALKRMRKEVRGWRIYRQTPGTLVELAKQYNPKIRGWWNYFGAFYRSAMHKLLQYIDQKLVQWATRKYKTLSRNKKRSARWLRRMKKTTPRMFFHWSVLGNQVG
jgi:hypothetical protein